MRHTKPIVEENVGTFIYSPLAPGYAITIGHSLRRVLLSSIPSCGIYGIFIPGITHQYATINGIKEDTLHIIQNLKKIRFKISNQNMDDVVAKIEFKGPGTVTSNNIIQSAELSVITPSSYICSIFDDIHFECNIYIKRGTGYIGLGTSELDVDKQFMGFIPVNSITNAVLNVSSEIKNVGYAGYTDYEELTLKVITDGSTTPTDAMNKAAGILTQNFAVIGNIDINTNQQNITHNTDSSSHEKKKEQNDKNILSASIRSLDIPTNICALLEESGICFATDLVAKTKSELMELPKLGARKISQIQTKLLEHGLDLKE